MSTEEEISCEDLANLAAMRGNVYGFLAGIYTRLPDQDFVQRLKDSGMIALLDSLTGAEADGEMASEMGAGLALVKSYLVASRDVPPDVLQTNLAVDRTRLLRGIKPGYGPPPPYESVYAGTDQMPQMEASVSVVQAYAEAGIALAEGIHDQPDFIGFELDFMRHLCAKEGESWKGGDQGQALKYLEKETGFLKEHITRWVPRYCDLMLKEARTAFYQGIARLTKGFVLDDAEKAAGYLEHGIALAWTDSDVDKLVDGFRDENILPTIPGLEFTRENVEGLLASSHCRQCGWCCQSHPYILVGSESDLKKLAQQAKVPYKVLKEKTVKFKNREGKESRYLTQPCMFYQDHKCRIYDARPFACRVYPISGTRRSDGRVDVSVDVRCDYGKAIYTGLKDHAVVKNA